MSDREGAPFPDRNRFMGYAARVMRGLIIDYAQRRQAQKRGGAFEITWLATDIGGPAAADADELTRVSDALRPEAATRIPNLVLAGDYVRTNTDLASMEGACEAARHAVNAILQRTGSPAAPAAIYLAAYRACVLRTLEAVGCASARRRQGSPVRIAGDPPRGTGGSAVAAVRGSQRPGRTRRPSRRSTPDTNHRAPRMAPAPVTVTTLLGRFARPIERFVAPRPGG